MCKYPLQDIHLLDAGCGTGQYAKALVDMGIGRISLLDASRDMLNVAETKLKDAITKNVVDVGIQAALPDLPFKEGTFDAVMYNLVSLTLVDLSMYDLTFSRPENPLMGTLANIKVRTRGDYRFALHLSVLLSVCLSVLKSQLV